ncbi:MAG: hypothetical protein ACI35S_09425, partial [Anaeroplasma sp.]
NLNSVNSFNLYAYCNNNPVMYYDPSGNSGIAAIVIGTIIAAVAIGATIHDIYLIANSKENGLSVSVSDNNIHIENSYKLLTPWMIYGYSFYLNHINPNTKDIIKGSTAGVQFEWELHNCAAWLGFGGDSAKHLDVGKSIFTDGKNRQSKDNNGNINITYYLSIGMRVGYIILGNPIYWIWDLIMNGGF